MQNGYLQDKFINGFTNFHLKEELLNALRANGFEQAYRGMDNSDGMVGFSYRKKIYRSSYSYSYRLFPNLSEL